MTRVTAAARLLVGVLMATAVSAGAHAAQRFNTVEAPREIPEFVLHDQHGERFDNAALKGRWSLVSLGFTHCPDVCPTVLSNLEAVRADLGLRLRPEAIPTVVFVAVDPARDAAQLRNYVRYFHPDYVGVTGAPDQLKIFVEGMDGFFRILPPRAGREHYDVQHTSLVYLIDPAGRVVASLAPPLSPHLAGEYIAGVIRRAAS